MSRKLVVAIVPVLVGAALLLTGESASASPTHCDSVAPYSWDGSLDSYVTEIPAVAHGISFTCIEQSGDLDHPKYTGATQVSLLQAALNKCDGAALKVDGKYGPKTAAAVQAVQKKYHLTQDGIYGPNTRDAMKWWIADDYVATGSVAHYCGWIS